MVAKQVITQWAKSHDGQPPLILAHAHYADVTAIINDIATAMFGSHNTATNPDLIVWQPEKATITIKEIRNVLDQLVRTPFKDQRLVVLTNVERLSQPAANALLKSLEEPSQTTKWLLLTAYPRQLLPTIISRCQLVRLLAAADPLAIAAAADDELLQLFTKLAQLLQEQGPTLEIRRGYLRLRDYYMIRSRRGNTKLAREILELSVPFKL